MKKIIGAIFVFLMIFPVFAGAVPAPNGRVNDFAGVLSPENRYRLAEALDSMERTSGVQMAVVTVTDLEGSTVDEYATTLFRQWGIGRKGIDNGILLLKMITDDPAVRGTTRLEIGYGLEGVINDAKAGRILDERVMPSFFAGRYGEGFENGVEAVAENLIAAGVTADGIERGEYKQIVPWFAKIGISIFLIPFIFIGGRGLGNAFRKGGLATLFGSIFGGVFTLFPLIIGATVLQGWIFFHLIAAALFIWAGYRYGNTKASSGAGHFFCSSSSFMRSSGGGSSFGGGSSGGGGATR